METKLGVLMDAGEGHLSRDQAAKLLKRLKADGKLIQHGERRGAF